MKENKSILLVLIGVLGELGILYFIHQSIAIEATRRVPNIYSGGYTYVSSYNKDIWNIIQTQGYINFVILFAIIIIVGLYICITEK